MLYNTNLQICIFGNDRTPDFWRFFASCESHKTTALGVRSVDLSPTRDQLTPSVHRSIAQPSAHFPKHLEADTLKKMKLLLAAAALMAGVSAKPGTIRINKAKGTFIASFVRSFEFCAIDPLEQTGLVG